MDSKYGLVRFCPYTTLKEQASTPANPLTQRIRDRKTLFIYLVLATIVLTPVVYGFFSEPQAKLVTLSDLDIRVVTDKEQYCVNDTIRAALYVYNNNPYPVRLEPIKHIYISGNIVSDNITFGDEKIVGMLYLDYPGSLQYLSIAANSSLVLYEHDFGARLPGEYRIIILGASTTVNVIPNQGA